MAFDPPTLPPYQPEWGNFQIWWQQVVNALQAEFGALEAAAQAQAAADAAAASAELAASVALERMADFAPVTFYADYTGTIDPPSQLPKTIQARRYNDATEVTALADWSISLTSGDADVSIDAATGVVTVNDLTTNSVVSVISERDIGGTIAKPLTLYFQTGSAPSGGGGTSDTATDTSFASFNAATYSAVSNELTVVVGSGGIVDMAAPLTATTAAASPAGNFGVKLQWQWWDGATWVDQGSEGAGTVFVTTDFPNFEVEDASVTANAQKTGLTPAASEKFRLMAKNQSGTRTMYVRGTATVAAS